MFETELISGITQFGFPIVAFLLLFFRQEKILKENTEVLQRLNITLEKHFFLEEKQIPQKPVFPES